MIARPSVPQEPKGSREAWTDTIPAEKPEGLRCTAFSSSNSRSSSERLLPREELITVGDGSADFCLLGKLQEAEERSETSPPSTDVAGPRCSRPKRWNVSLLSMEAEGREGMW